MAFSIRDAAFEGFRLTRERPSAVAAWAVLQLVVFAGVFVAMALSAPQFQRMAHLMSDMDPTAPATPAMLETMAGVMPAYGLILGLTLLIYPVLNTGVYRAVLRPQDRGLFSLKLGADELRQLLVVVIVWAVGVGVYVAGSMVTGLLFSILGVGGPAVAALGLVIGVAATIAALVWILLRLSLAGPLTLDVGRLAVFDSWRLTKGRLGPLFGAYLLSWLMAFVVSACFNAIFAAVAGAIVGDVSPAKTAASDMFASLVVTVDFSSAKAVTTTALNIAHVIYSGLVGGLTVAIVAGANARAYQLIKNTPVVV